MRSINYIKVSKVLFTLCLFLPAYTTGSNWHEWDEWHIGLELLITGPIGLIMWHFSWLANPLLWFAWKDYQNNENNSAQLKFLAAMGLALSFLFYDEVAVGSAGMYSFSVHIGYWIWLGSIAIMVEGVRQRNITYKNELA